MSRQRLLTSDYESSDSPPSSSELHSELAVRRSSSAERSRRDAVTDDAERDASPSPSTPPSCQLQFADQQVSALSSVVNGGIYLTE